MKGSGSRQAAYLALDELAPNPSLARRLPADLARRFHALPLSEDSGRVTVAMANPNDRNARKVIASILGATSCVVRGDEKAIDACLAAVWSDVDDPFRIAVCDIPRPVSSETRDYAHKLGNLLGIQPSRLNGDEMGVVAQGSWPADQELLIVETADHPLIHRLVSKGLHGPASHEPDYMPRAVLVACKPRWPLKRILLVLCGGEGGAAAIDWVLPIAQRAHSAVTVLAVVPPAPAMYGRQACGDLSLPALLAASTPLGRQMRQVARQLVDSDIESTLRLRQGAPDWQIRREVVESDCDLIATGARPCPGLLRWMGRDQTDCVLHGCDRPVLIACPTTA